jgi:hypothetical protein
MISLSDPEIDKYLNKGIKYLDKITFTKQKDSRFFVPLSRGNNILVLPAKCRVLKDVWVHTQGSSGMLRHQLGKLSIDDMRDPQRRYFWYQYWYSVYFFDTLATQEGPGRPSYYCPNVGGLASDTTADKASVYANLADLTADGTDSRTVALFATANQDYTVEVYGNFFSPELSDKVVKNWWTANHPDLVIMASLFSMDRTYRNTSGGQELGAHIAADVLSLNNDDIEEETMSAGSSVMGG